MNEELKTKLLSLGLTEEHIAKLVEEGVASEEDMTLLSDAEVKSVTGCGLITAKKVVKAFAPVVVPVVPVTVAAPVVEPVAVVAPAPDAVIPEGANPNPAQVTSFATSMGMDPTMLTMLMFGGMANGSGMDMDISGLIPVPQIVAGYSPKVRNMYYMVMGSLQKHYGENPIVVINADGGVNREQTVAYIQSLEEGFEPADEDIYYDEAGTAYQLIKVGVDAQSIYDADPLESTRALAQNGMGRGRINWKNIPLEVKQVAYYAVTQTREIDPSNEAHLTWLRDHIKVGVNRLVFQGQAPKALQAYNEALRSGTLPQLRVMLGRSARRREVMPRRRSTTPRDLAGIGREADL